jgi:hypothetical protein
LSSNNKILFLTKNSKFSYNSKVNIVLSPELYWVRIFDIPIKNSNDILKVLPSLFEDFLDIERYKFYFINLEDDKKMCFAYDEDLIFKSIKNSGLSPKKVSKIYFAQIELSNLDSFKIDNEYFIYQDKILLKVPAQFVNLDEIVNYEIDNIKLSKHSIYLNKTNKYIDMKSLYTISIFLFIIALINFTKISFINKDIDKLKMQQIKSYKRYKLPPTLVQTKSIIKNLQKKQSKQIALRKKLQKFFNLDKKNIKRVYLKNGNINYE